MGIIMIFFIVMLGFNMIYKLTLMRWGLSSVWKIYSHNHAGAPY
jgi:hypothetical protein